MLDVNPAKLGVENPQRRYREKRPFESWEELYALADILGPRHGPMVLAAATGLRPGEWLALEARDVDREARVLYVLRTFRNGRIKTPKTKASVRAVPLQAIALSALDERPPNPESGLVFPSANGGHFDEPCHSANLSGIGECFWTRTGGASRARVISMSYAGASVIRSPCR